ncbi:MAG: radical SAM protein, partial [Phycisphaerae bacterium]|nr:radical SAM protein [Phycisphaerae bacterium]
MIDLRNNRYNQNLPRGCPQFKAWRYAGLMLSYRCNASCRFCYYHCRPDGRGLMSVETAIHAWEGLHRLAGAQTRIHLTGGEPFLFFDRMAEIVQEAHRLGLTPIESIETNGGWATDEVIIRDRIDFLNRHGMDRLKISWDPFHAEFIDIQTVRRLV